MKKPIPKFRSLLTLVLALSVTLALSACGKQAENAAPNFLLDCDEDGICTVTLDRAGKGSGGMAYLDLAAGQTMAVETQLEGSSALLLQVCPGDGGDMEQVSAEAASGSTEPEYLLEETVSGTNTYSFALEPGAYSILVTTVDTSTGTARIFPEGEIAKREDEQNADLSAPEQNQDDYYVVCTDFDKATVEAYAAQVRETILNQDWETLSGMLDYPISMTADTQVENAEEFLAFLKGKKISTAFLDAVEQESCVDMFANYQGICMQSGEVWIGQVGEEPELRVIALNGMVSER